MQTTACVHAPSTALPQVGSYFSTKIWAFTMRHHCGCKITITTDPKNAEYIVTEGARRKIETYDPDDAQVRGWAPVWQAVLVGSLCRTAANPSALWWL